MVARIFEKIQNFWLHKPNQLFYFIFYYWKSLIYYKEKIMEEENLIHHRSHTHFEKHKLGLIKCRGLYLLSVACANCANNRSKICMKNWGFTFFAILISSISYLLNDIHGECRALWTLPKILIYSNVLSVSQKFRK